MRTLYYDCFSGISGDMNLGALIDVGVDKEYLIKELSKLNLDEYELKIDKDNRKGITGTKVDVILKHHSHTNSASSHDHHNVEHDHISGENHKHCHNDNNHEHNHHHRNLQDIELIIQKSNLNENIKNISLGIFKKVAEAEAKVHGKTMKEVHFHEVGAVDSIVDIVGAAICFDCLKIDRIKASTVEVGSGFVKCAHGVMPVPAPATVEILKGVPLRSNLSFEATTPTGAAILAYAVEEFTDRRNFKIDKIGYGIGQKDIGDIPNVLRVYIGEEIKEEMFSNDLLEDPSEYQELTADEVEVTECNIDDMNPEMYDYIMELLFNKGALDVYLTPIIMKKGRPAVKLNVIYTKEKSEEIREIILTQTTTLGIRKYKAHRDILKRDFVKVKTKYGEITVKNAYYKGKKIKSKPEYGDCKRAALENKVSINDVYSEVALNDR
ncbi:nickel pincer cofactor biosynthesis protein LarC [Clostridium sp. A1-XYC3]|uniref:Pyridinium-3,5-bisthiocarboxylic acid mononucleotide nickel insertion protein n=1 Tax=Clostridium tanneri TaxID=3037988 RepID=A0ABU4JR63_9CLOT|nr:nickel pincer cofactor biosynthesis protein LarC [Clostridium sp. A1-XYC3]MDW8800613.1 nickel pincer cofactor biosynthesis protein LarC [Clostridium sp. A1-XYC3]